MPTVPFLAVEFLSIASGVLFSRVRDAYDML